MSNFPMARRNGFGSLMLKVLFLLNLFPKLWELIWALQITTSMLLYRTHSQKKESNSSFGKLVTLPSIQMTECSTTSYLAISPHSATCVSPAQTHLAIFSYIVNLLGVLGRNLPLFGRHTAPPKRYSWRPHLHSQWSSLHKTQENYVDASNTCVLVDYMEREKQAPLSSHR